MSYFIEKQCDMAVIDIFKRLIVADGDFCVRCTTSAESPTDCRPCDSYSGFVKFEPVSDEFPGDPLAIVCSANVVNEHNCYLPRNSDLRKSISRSVAGPDLLEESEDVYRVNEMNNFESRADLGWGAIYDFGPVVWLGVPYLTDSARYWISVLEQKRVRSMRVGVEKRNRLKLSGPATIYWDPLRKDYSQWHFGMSFGETEYVCGGFGNGSGHATIGRWWGLEYLEDIGVPFHLATRRELYEKIEPTLTSDYDATQRNIFHSGLMRMPADQ